MANLDLVEENLGETRLLAPVGEVDARSVPELQKKLLGWVGEGQRSILVDCSRLEGIAGAGLRVLTATAERLEAAGGALALCSVRPQIQKVLEVARMDRTLNVHPDRAEAWQWLRETVHRERLALFAARLLRLADKQHAPRGPANVDVRRVELAARLLSERRDPGDETGVSRV